MLLISRLPEPRSFFMLLAAATVILILFAASAVRASIGLTSFEAKAQGTTIVVTWETETELDTTGFRLYRALSAAPADWGAPIYETRAVGGIVPASYSYNDTDVATGVLYYYLLEALSTNGSTSRYGPVSAGVGLPDQATSTPTVTPTSTPTATAIWNRLYFPLTWKM